MISSVTTCTKKNLIPPQRDVALVTTKCLALDDKIKCLGYRHSAAVQSFGERVICVRCEIETMLSYRWAWMFAVDMPCISIYYMHVHHMNKEQSRIYSFI